MKRKNGQNIITDCDVTVTGPSNLGNSLDTVIEEFSEDIHDLKSQLKWTHKYGAVGSGSGGGSGALKWSIAATLDGQTIEDGKTISLSKGANNYSLKIAVSGGSETYHATYSYGNVSYSIELSSANRWRTDLTIPLSSNGIVSIEVTDNIVIKNIYSSYIVVPYEFSDLSLCRNSEQHSLINYDNTNIFINTAAEEGLYAKFNYDITVNAECSYTWRFLNDVKHGEITDKKGYIAYNIAEVLDLIDANANSYNIELTIEISPENQTSQVIEKSLVFNLIPNSLYLQLVPQTGLIYDSISTDLDNIYQYSINREIGFTAKVYNGINNNRDIDIFCWRDDEQMPDTSYKGQEGKTYTFAVSYSTEGWHRVHFMVQMGVDSVTVTKYLYCQQVASDFDWFRSVSPSLELGYRGYSAERMIGEVSPEIDTNYIRVYRANEDPEQYLLNYSSNPDEPTNVLINIGVQYGEVNNTSDPICTIVSTDDKDFVKIYQNKVSISGVTNDTLDCNLFLPKEKQYSPGDVEKYHLITISIAAVYFNSSTNETFYEYNVYLDGVLEGALNAWPNALKIIKRFDFNPGNYCINHFSVDYFGGQRGVSVLKDTDINYYYYSYKVTSRNSSSAVSDGERNILNFLYDPTTNKVNYTMDHDLIKLSSTTFYDDVAANTSVPTLVFQVSEIQETIEGSPSIFEWMNTSYTQDSTNILANAKISTKLKWGVGTRTDAINIAVDNHEFFIKLQGSSTMNNKSKNFTLGLQKRSQDDGPTVLFSPNFVKDDPSTFLPETSFTLKADVVDSSHTNNVAMGKFINEWNNFDYDMHQSNVDSDILSHVRKCLDGFPVLVYLETIGADGQSITGDYFLGIYSFNLGRDSYFNLGYSDLSQLDPNYITDATNTTFTFTTVGSGNSRGLNPLDGFVSAEVQDNSNYWDFSQYDNTILFKQGDESANYMFGDIATYAGNTGANSSIQEFVRRVSKAGGYLFKEMGKTFVNVKNELDPNSNEYVYHTPNVVPDYRTQYVRNNKEYSIKEVVSDAQYSDLLACVGGEQDGEQVDGFVNFNSLSNYYTTCMTFGLVDSVQKNLTIKTWDDRKFGAFFYDMDTCLGRDNNGNPTSYFCFSDYWRSDIKEYDENGDLIDRALNPNAVAVKTINNGVTVDRDYFPITEKIVGYDIPSSYLFALAKYVKTLPDYKDDNSYESPQTIYGRWRSVGGPLETAETFINRYYASNLANVPDCLLNLNYRNKYLYYSNDNKDKTSFDSISKFLFGRGIGVTTNWLNGRLHILDAYFNLESADIIINGPYVEPIPVAQNLNNNSDIIILKDMFAQGNQPWSRKSSNLEFLVTAPDYTPLIIRGANSVREFLLEHSDVEYTIKTSFNGVQTSTFGGSQLWSTLDSINSFVESSAAMSVPLYLNNPYIEYLSGTSGTYTGGFNLVLPAVKEINLNSSGYAGALQIDNSFGNLTNIDISNSSISLDANESIVKTINAQGVNSTSLYITNCNSLTNVNLLNASIQDCRIRPAWTKDINLSNNKIKTLTITGKSVGGQYGTLTIGSNQTITTVGFDSFKNVNITNCQKLTKLTSNDSDHSMIKTLSVTNCPNLTSIAIWADGLTSLDVHDCVRLTELVLLGNSTFPNLTNLNISNTKVTSIKFALNASDSDVLDLTKFTNLGKTATGTINVRNITGIRIIKVTNDRNNPVKLTTSLTGCSDLERIYGNVTVCCASCFSELKKFSIHGPNLSNMTWHGAYVLAEQNNENNKKVKHPLDIVSLDNFFSDGDQVTNMKLDVANVSNAFQRTNCTVFDYYYILANIGTSVRNINNLFIYAQNTDWGFFDYRNNNNIDSKTFINCGNVTSVSFIFGYNTNYVYYKSPTITNGTVSDDNGLMSPLINATDISGMFYGGTYYCDRFIFRRNSGNYSANTLNFFNPVACFNTPVNDTESAITQALSNIENCGNLTGFFNNLPNLTSIGGLFNNVNYINYDASIFTIPSGCMYILSCFNSNLAKGTEFIPSDFFATPSNVRVIGQSFRQATKDENHVVKMPLRNDTFSSFINLVTLGYDAKTNGNFAGNYTTSSFKGFVKTIDSSGFPFDIFINCPNLTTITGVFEDAESSDPIPDLKLPGNLFRNNRKLQETSRMFFDIKIPYQLSDDINFKNCPNINIVDYMFGQTPENATEPVLSGFIPYKFFMHGSSSRTVYPLSGTDTRTEVQFEGEPIYEYGELQTPDSFTVPVYSANISSMKGCFQHSNLSPYRNTNPEVENNPEYNPYQYVSVDGEMQEVEVKPRYTFIWSYDGQNKPLDYNSTDYEMLDTLRSNDLVTSVDLPIEDAANGFAYPSQNFIAPPDLLRYCRTNCNIDYLFSDCGLSGWSSRWNGTNGYYNMLGYGLTGRICPYMLKPVPSVSSVKGLFKCCKKLSYYYREDNGTKSYMIPEGFFEYAPNIIELQEMFKDTLQPKHSDLMDTFKPLTGTLNITDIFNYAYWDGTNSLIQVFKTNEISATLRAFAIRLETEISSDRKTDQNIMFSDMFNNKYARPVYSTNTKFYQTFCGYSANTVQFGTKTLNEDERTHNYFTW